MLEALFLNFGIKIPSISNKMFQIQSRTSSNLGNLGKIRRLQKTDHSILVIKLADDTKYAAKLIINSKNIYFLHLKIELIELQRKTIYYMFSLIKQDVRVVRVHQELKA
jgi:hypothetical protein